MERAIISALPDIGSEVADLVREHLIALGVKDVTDLKYVREEDLCVLSKIQARKAIAFWNNGRLYRWY
jgi:hypothetical protein